MKKKDTPVATLESPKASAIIQTLVVRPSKIETYDVSAWKTAVNGFKNGNRTKYYDLAENIASDTYVSDAIDKRVRAITNAEITFQVDGKNVEAIDDLIDTPEFEELIREIILSQAYGKSVIETAFVPEFSVFSYPRKHIRIAHIDRPLSERRKYIVSKESDQVGYEYAEDPFIIEVGKDDDLGFIFRVAPYVIYKRGGFGDWAQFAEIFGMPFVTGKYDSYDTKTRDLLFEALSNIGSNPIAAIPKEADIEIKENKSSGSTDLYDTLRKACNEEILVGILGNSMTTVNGSSKSQGEVHLDQQQEIHKSDRRLVQRVLNRKLVPLLIQRGYPVVAGASIGYFGFPDAKENMTTKQRVELGIMLKKNDIAVSDDYFYEVTGIPKAESKDPEPKDPDQKKPDKKEPQKTETKKEEETDNLNDRNFFIKLLDYFFVDAPTLRSGASRNYKGILRSNTTITLADDYSIDINALIKRAIKEIYASKGAELINENLFKATNTPLQHAVDTGLSEVKGDHADFVKQFKTNTAIFSAFKNHQQTAEMAALMIDENGKLRTFSKFRRMAEQLSAKYNVEWLQTEYNTAISAARTAANLLKFQQTKHLYPNLEYIQSIAAHPRELHLTWVGTILPMDHEWWNTHMPPSDWNCSCSVRQTDKSPTAVPDGDAKPAFATNAQKEASFVKLDETPYYQHTDEGKRKDIINAAKQMMDASQDVKISLYKGGKGGKLEIVKQNGNEAAKNLVTYKIMADNGGNYTLLGESFIDGVKNPDAYNNNLKIFSDAKHPVSKTGKNAIQNSIKSASNQGVEEVIIRLGTDYSSHDLYEGFKTSLIAGRAIKLQRIVLIRNAGKPIVLDVEKLRKRFIK